MIQLSEAYKTVMDHAHALPGESVVLAEATGRILCQDIVSDMDMPPFDKSAMDGYACRAADLPGPLEVLGFVGAGQQSEIVVSPGGCVKIMTGAAVPTGADVVVPVEEIDELPGGAIRGPATYDLGHIVGRAEDVRKGQRVLEKGARIRPQEIAVLCAVGCTHPQVSRLPRVAVLATGDELVEPESRPPPAGIRNSNSHQLVAQLRRLGVTAQYLGIAKDTTQALDEAILKSSGCDVLLVSGGVSAGDLDLVPAALQRAGYELLFEKVAVKPGKPTVFGSRKDSLCFGLPGNPVSTYVIFELLVAPLLLQMMGSPPRAVTVVARLERDFRRRLVEREEWVPVRLASKGTVDLIDYHGSGHIHALTAADGLMHVPISVEGFSRGDLVDVRLLP